MKNEDLSGCVGKDSGSCATPQARSSPTNAKEFFVTRKVSTLLNCLQSVKINKNLLIYTTSKTISTILIKIQWIMLVLYTKVVVAGIIDQVKTTNFVKKM